MTGAAQPANPQGFVIVEMRGLDSPGRTAFLTRLGPLDVPCVNVVTNQRLRPSRRLRRTMNPLYASALRNDLALHRAESSGQVWQWPEGAPANVGRFELPPTRPLAHGRSGVNVLITFNSNTSGLLSGELHPAVCDDIAGVIIPLMQVVIHGGDRLGLVRPKLHHHVITAVSVAAASQ